MQGLVFTSAPENRPKKQKRKPVNKYIVAEILGDVKMLKLLPRK